MGADKPESRVATDQQIWSQRGPTKKYPSWGGAVKVRTGNTVRRRNHAQLDALARADLLAIARRDFGSSKLPDSADGKRYLRAYILKKMPAMQVFDVAPWTRGIGVLSRVVDDADAERRVPNARRLGELIGFTFEALVALKRAGITIRHVEPCDADRWKVAEFWKAERKDADRERKRRKRMLEQIAMPNLSSRAKVVYRAIGPHWTGISAIMDNVAPALPEKNGRLLAKLALRRAVNRALDKLVAQCLAEVKIEVGEHGMPTRFARRATVCSATGNSPSACVAAQ